MEKFDNVKVGDEVVVCSRWGKKICFVTSVSPKRFKVGATTFTREDGCEYGTGYSARDYCFHPTEELRKEIARRERFGMMRRKLSNVNVNSWNFELTEKVYNFLLELSLIMEE